MYGQLRRHLGQVFRQLAAEKESRIEEGHLLVDHVHMLIAIPPRYAVSQVVGFINAKQPDPPGARLCRAQANFVGHYFWARGYFVSTVVRDETVIREYIQRQEEAHTQLDPTGSVEMKGHRISGGQLESRVSDPH